MTSQIGHQVASGSYLQFPYIHVYFIGIKTYILSPCLVSSLFVILHPSILLQFVVLCCSLLHPLLLLLPPPSSSLLLPPLLPYLSSLLSLLPPSLPDSTTPQDAVDSVMEKLQGLRKLVSQVSLFINAERVQLHLNSNSEGSGQNILGIITEAMAT